MNATIPTKFRGRARRDAAAFCLSEIARALLSGELALQAGDECATVTTSEFLTLEIEVKQKKRANHVGIKLRWPNR